jgi:hypothetical protein
LQELSAALKLAEERYLLYGNEIDIASEKQDAFKAAIDRLLQEGMSAANPIMQKLIDKYKALAVSSRDVTLKELDESLKRVEERFKLYGEEVDVAKEKQAAFKTAIDKLSEEGLAANDPLMERLIKRYQDLGAAVEPMEGNFERMNQKMKEQADIANTVAAPAATAFAEKISVIGRANDAMKTSMEAAGSSLTSYAAQGGKSLKELGKAALKSAADVVRAMLMAAVAAAFESMMLAAGMSGPLAILAASAAAAATGVAFNAAISSLKIPALASGGIATGPTMALVGEYAGARGNPEVIAPLDKLKSMLQGAGGGAVAIYGESRVLGEDLRIVYERNERVDRRAFNSKGGLYG